MKYVIIIPDGAADLPLEALDGRTPLEAAATPHLDELSAAGRQGTAVTTPPGMACGSDVCTMSLLGYDPARYHTGRAPLEAAALGLEIAPSDWVFRVNLVSVLDGLMQDHSAGHISSGEGRQLIHDFAAALAEEAPGMTLHPGVSYRNIMVDRSGRSASAQTSDDPLADGAAFAADPVSAGAGGTGGAGDAVARISRRDWSDLVTVAPHDIPGEAIRDHLPTIRSSPGGKGNERGGGAWEAEGSGGGGEAELLQRLIARSEVLFADHEINLTRREMGELSATHLWPWGQGHRPSLPPFEARFGLQGAMITAVDLLAGLSRFIGWDRLDVPGQTSYHDTDYVAAGRAAVAALDDYDMICVHVESPDEASHAADPAVKVAAIEAIDRHVVGPLHQALTQRSAAAGAGGEPWRMLVLPDHYTRVDTRKHDPTPVPFLMIGENVHAVRHRPFSERHARQSDLHIPHGHELMEYFLYSGLTGT